MLAPTDAPTPVGHCTDQDGHGKSTVGHGEPIMKTSGLLFTAALLVASGSISATGQPATTGPVGLKLTPVLETTTTITGQPIRFPQGDNQLTAVIAEVAPGGHVGRHMHPMPLFVYMLEG